MTNLFFFRKRNYLSVLFFSLMVFTIAGSSYLSAATGLTPRIYFGPAIRLSSTESDVFKAECREHPDCTITSAFLLAGGFDINYFGKGLHPLEVGLSVPVINVSSTRNEFSEDSIEYNRVSTLAYIVPIMADFKYYLNDYFFAGAGIGYSVGVRKSTYTLRNETWRKIEIETPNNEPVFGLTIGSGVYHFTRNFRLEIMVKYIRTLGESATSVILPSIGVAHRF